MEYVFGYTKRNGVIHENLKTISDTYSELKDYIETVRKYTDSVITDKFRIVDHYHSEEGDDGLFYDWYIIDNHWRNVDKFSSERLIALEETTNDVILEILADHEYRISLAEIGFTDEDL